MVSSVSVLSVLLMSLTKLLRYSSRTLLRMRCHSINTSTSRTRFEIQVSMSRPTKIRRCLSASWIYPEKIEIAHKNIYVSDLGKIPVIMSESRRSLLVMKLYAILNSVLYSLSIKNISFVYINIYFCHTVNDYFSIPMF